MENDWGFSLSLSPQHAWSSSLRLLAFAWSSDYAIADLSGSEWENQEVAGVNGSALGKKHLNSLLSHLRSANERVNPKKITSACARVNVALVGSCSKRNCHKTESLGWVEEFYYTFSSSCSQSFNLSGIWKRRETMQSQSRFSWRGPIAVGFVEVIEPHCAWLCQVHQTEQSVAICCNMLQYVAMISVLW